MRVPLLFGPFDRSSNVSRQGLRGEEEVKDDEGEKEWKKEIGSSSQGVFMTKAIISYNTPKLMSRHKRTKHPHHHDHDIYSHAFPFHFIQLSMIWDQVSNRMGQN